MYLKNVEYACDVSLRDSHAVSFITRWGWFSDSLEILVDDEAMLKTRSGWGRWSGSHGFLLDDQPVEARWRWSFWMGNPIYIILVNQGRIVAQYGNRKVIERLGLLT